MIIRVKEKNGAELQFVSDGSITETGEGSSRCAIGYIEVPRPETVEFEVNGTSETRIISVSPFNFWKMFIALVVGIVIAGVGALSGVGLIYWGLRKRQRTLRDRSLPPISLGGVPG